MLQQQRPPRQRRDERPDFADGPRISRVARCSPPVGAGRRGGATVAEGAAEAVRACRRCATAGDVVLWEVCAAVGAAAGEAAEKKARKEADKASETGSATLDKVLATVRANGIAGEGDAPQDYAVKLEAAGVRYARALPVFFNKMLLGQNLPVFDDCDDVRGKLLELQKTSGATTAAMCKLLGYSRAYAVAQHRPNAHEEQPAINGNSWGKFMRLKGKLSGNQHELFYLGYVLFEKVRVADGAAKTTKTTASYAAKHVHSQQVRRK